MEPEELPDVPDKILEEHKTEELFSGNASLSTVFKHYEKKCLIIPECLFPF